MKNTVFDGNVSVEFPDDFREMSEEEVGKYFGGGLPRLGVINPDKHVIMSISRTNDSFLGLIASSSSVLSGAERSLSRLKDYRCLERLDSTLLGKPAKAIRFRYAASDKGTQQYGEMRVVKHKRRFYISYCLSRLEGKDENEQTFIQFNESIRFQ